MRPLDRYSHTTPCWTPAVGCHTFSSVPSVSKNAGHTAKADGPSFEQALKKLEDIVEAMEAEDLPLETLLTRYEEGTRLAKVCQEKLAEAEVKIQQLEQTATGELKVKPAPNLEATEGALNPSVG